MRMLVSAASKHGSTAEVATHIGMNFMKAVVTALRVADGDFRNFDAVDAWGTQIAAELSQARIGKA